MSSNIENIEQCFLYVITTVADDKPISPCKIGISNNFKSRLNTVQTGNPKHLEVLMAIPIPERTLCAAIEAIIHEHFRDKRLKGEWFDLDPVEASLVSCGIAYAAFCEVGLSDDAALAACNNLGISNVVRACLKYQSAVA